MDKKKEFEKFIDQLGSLYEEGKDCLNSLTIIKDEQDKYHRLFGILKEIRDLSANHAQQNLK